MTISKEDWIQIHRKSKWYNELKTDILTKFLQIPSRKVLCTNKKYDGGFYKYVISVCLDSFLKENKFTVEDHFGVSENDFYPLRKEDIEISPNKYKRCLIDGLLFLKRDNYKFVLEFEELYRGDNWHINIFYRPEDEEETLKFLTDLEAYALENNYLKKAKITPELEHIKINQDYTWDDVILPTAVKEELKSNIDTLFKNIEIYKNAKLTFKRGIILQGVPGTGKTLIGKVLCKTCDCAFVWVTPKFLGRAEHIATVCTLVRLLAPSILFLEDIDLYGEHRDVSRDKGILGELMNQLDGLIENEFVVVIATTNDVQHVEEALRNRPGRFDRIIEIQKPDLECRIKLFELFTKPHILKDVDIKKVAQLTDDFTGAHVKELVIAAVISAIDSGSIDVSKKIILTKEHFKKNIDKVKQKKIQPVGFGGIKKTSDEGVGIPDQDDW